MQSGGKPAFVASITKENTIQKGEVILDHYIFKSQEGWQKSESMSHPTLKLLATTVESDYNHLGIKCPKIQSFHVTTVSDTGAQSCLWGLKEFLRSGFKKSDLIPVKQYLSGYQARIMKVRYILLLSWYILVRTRSGFTCPGKR